MINFPNAKINLGLRITSKRNDGYHNLDTVFFPIPLCDVLELVGLHASDGKDVVFHCSGKSIPESKGGNICIKAYQLIKAAFPQIPPVQIHLHKVIPMGAGLGGGSADGAFMLMLLNEKFNLSIPTEKLEAYALQLGSDCPFFIRNKPAHGSGRGEILQEIDLDLKGRTLVLISPGIHVSTATAFAAIRPMAESLSCAEAVKKPIEQWKDFLVNDFEKSVFSHFPELGVIKEKLYQKGALYASMTGTGSTVYGIFDTVPELDGLFPAAYERTVIAEGKVKH